MFFFLFCRLAIELFAEEFLQKTLVNSGCVLVSGLITSCLASEVLAKKMAVPVVGKLERVVMISLEVDRSKVVVYVCLRRSA